MHPNFSHNIYQMLHRHAEQVLLVWPTPDGPPAQYTGADVLVRIQAVDAALATRNIRPGESVLLTLPVSVELIGALLAVMMRGAVPVLPPAAASPLALLKLLRDARINTVLTTPRLRRRLGWLGRLLNVQLLTAAAPSTAPLAAPAEVSPEQAALVSHSSGSTGRAKAIRRSHRVLAAQHRVLSEVFPAWAGQRDFPLFPNILLHNLSLGVLSILPDIPWTNLADLEPARLVRQLQAERVQTLTGNVFYFAALCRHLRQHPAALPAVRALGVGGSPVPETLLRELRGCFPATEVYVIYGSSEAEPIAVRPVARNQRSALAKSVPRRAAGEYLETSHPTRSQGMVRTQPVLCSAEGTVQALADASHSPAARRGTDLANADLWFRATAAAGYCVGPVVAALECRLRPLGTLTLPDGRRPEVGEITVRGPHVAAPAGEWLRTGDFGYFDEQGQLWLTGRQGNETIHRGVQHYQLEHVLLHLPGVERAAARATPAGFDIYVQGSAAETAIRHALNAHFPPGLCNRIHRRAHLPVDRRHLSKIRYDQLR